MHSRKFLVTQAFNIADYSTLFLPPKCMAESFTSTSCTIFSGLQLANDLYNLMNFCIHTRLLPRNSFCFVSQASSRTRTLLPAKSNVFSNKLCATRLYFILLLVIRYNRCRGRSNPHYFVWYHFKIIICNNFDIRNRNAEIGLENRYDSAKKRNGLHLCF